MAIRRRKNITIQNAPKEILQAWKDLEEGQRQRYREVVYEKTRLRGKSLENKAFQTFVSDYDDLQRDAEYRRGAEGMIKWTEENVRFKIPHDNKVRWLYPGELPDDRDEYGRSPYTMWEHLKGEIRNALATDEHGNYKYKVIVFCWPRGEAKSFLVVLISLYRFFCFPFQQIYFSATSKDQSDTMHFKIAKEIIENSPRLVNIVGAAGITEEEIRIFAEGRGRFNSIEILSTSSGLVSNASVVTQAEAFEMANDSFYVKWSGSLRNTPQAIGLIDTTASSKEHWLYQNLFVPAKNDPDGLVYFSYRFSKDAVPEDYWHPGMTKRQIKHYMDTLPSIEFARYFKNLFDTSETMLFAPEEIAAVHYLGIDGHPGGHKEILETIKYQQSLDESEAFMQKEFSKGVNHAGYWEANPDRIAQGTQRLWRVDQVYGFGRHSDADEHSIRSGSRWADMNDLETLSAIYNTHWALIVGIDRADPTKYMGRLQARTVMPWILKGLPGSLGQHETDLNKRDLAYVYFLLGLVVVGNSLNDTMIEVLKRVKNEFERIDMVCGETYGMGDIVPWCEKEKVPHTIAYASKDRQRIGYTELITTINTGRFKAPPVPVHGSKSADILVEEMSVLDDVSGISGLSRVKPKADGIPKYGSPQKMKKGGIQDDVMDALCWAMYGGISLTAAHFKERKRMFSGDSFGGLYDGMARVAKVLSGYYGGVKITMRR